MNNYPYNEKDLELLKEVGIIIPTEGEFIPGRDCKKNCDITCFGGDHKLFALLSGLLPCSASGTSGKGLMSSSINTDMFSFEI